MTNRKPLLFWGTVAAACVCAAFAWGPAIGCYCFIGMAVALIFFG